MSNQNLHQVALPAPRLNNTSVGLIGNPESRQSQLFTQVLNATGTVGATISVNIPGTTFYLAYASGPLVIRPHPGGSFNQYVMGTGMRMGKDKAFTRLDIQNPGTNPVLFQLFIGFDEFVDNRLVISNTQYPLFAFPTYPAANAAASIAITDRTNSKTTDINGTAFYAISREAIYCFNVDAGTTFLLQKAGSGVSNGPAVGAIYPTTSLRFPVTGNYSIATGGGNINMIVSELYYGIAA